MDNRHARACVCVCVCVHVCICVHRHAEALKFMQAVRDLLKFSPAEYQEQHTARMSEHMTAIQNSTSITPLAQGLQQVITAAHV